jgi:hypothetical protein
VRTLVAVPLALAVLGAQGPARAADVTSWLAIGGGYAIEHKPEASAVASSTDGAAVFSGTLGVGSSPRSRLVVGGVFRSLTHFSMGTDVSVALRGATGGFARGGWGVAIDAGIAARWWRSGDYGRYPLQFILTAGAPWGLQIGVGAHAWSVAGEHGATGGFAVVELDLLRLTLMRQGSTEAWWRNPAPAGGHLDAP